MRGNYIGGFPLLIALYHGALPFWFGLPFCAVFGTGLLGVRVAHAAFALLVVAAAANLLRVSAGLCQT